MTLIVDAAPIVALADPNDPEREAVLATLTSETGALVVPAPVTAEIDYLLGQRFGSEARRAFVRDVSAERFLVASLNAQDHTTALAVDERYADLDLGLSDCSVVVLADRFGTNRILTFDQRHFRAVTPLQGGSFTILPADA